MRKLCCCLLLGCAVMPAAAQDATIIGVYEQCVAVSSTVVVKAEQLTESRASQIAARAEAAGSGLAFERALPRMVASLERDGVQNIRVVEQGRCQVRDEDRTVEAVATYCGTKLVTAELFVDGAMILRQSGDRLTLDGFVAESRNRLRESGVVGEPEISLHNSAECETAAQP